jgi:hypothetical protein
MNDDAASRDERGSESHGRRNPEIVILICLAGGGVGAFFGSFEFPLGTVLGGLGGIVAGVTWAGILLDRARQGYSRGGLVGTGTIWGMVVGILATLILHGGLAAWHSAEGRASPTEFPGLFLLLVGVILAVPAGAFTGAICGLLVPVKRT